MEPVNKKEKGEREVQENSKAYPGARENINENIQGPLHVGRYEWFWLKAHHDREMDLKSYTSEKDNRKEKKKPAVLQA